MQLSRYIPDFMRFVITDIKLGRWRHTGLPCQVKISNCSHLQWDDYSYGSNVTLINNRITEIKLKNKLQESKGKNII